ncbi:MAG TPA: sigma factor [Acidimicrobiia bacterium]|nr:sigma factor [Acidimicrobiia bacterium]
MESFETFYRREYDKAVRLALVLSGSRWGAEDLAQEAFIEAHRRWEDIGRYEDPEGWVRRVISNQSVSSRTRRT